MTTLQMCLFLERERDLPPRGAVLGLSWTLCWRSWAAPGTYAAGLGALLGLCCRSWAALGPYVEGLEPLLGPLLAVLGGLGLKSGQGRRSGQRSGPKSRRSSSASGCEARRGSVSEAFRRNLSFDFCSQKTGQTTPGKKCDQHVVKTVVSKHCLFVAGCLSLLLLLFLVC